LAALVDQAEEAAWQFQVLPLQEHRDKETLEEEV
jgi:hypothetical protein